MANTLITDPNGKSSEELKNILLNQYLIDGFDTSYCDYTSDVLFRDICNILRKVEYVNETGLIKNVNILLTPICVCS